MGKHSWVRVIAGASALQVPPPVTHPSPASRPAQGIPARRSPHATNPLPHLPAPARHHRQAHAHEPRLPAPDAYGAPGSRIGQATASPAPPRRTWPAGSWGRTRPRSRSTPPNAPCPWWARFSFNGITRSEQRTYGLVGGVAEGFCAAAELSDAEREELLERRQSLDAFREQRG